MTEAYRCDNCRKVEPQDGLIGWLEVHRIGLDVSMVGEDTNDRHYCSMYCLWRTANEKTDGGTIGAPALR